MGVHFFPEKLTTFSVVVHRLNLLQLTTYIRHRSPPSKKIYQTLTSCAAWRDALITINYAPICFSAMGEHVYPVHPWLCVCLLLITRWHGSARVF